MTDNDIYRILLPFISAALIADGYTGVTVKQAYQPTQQGINTNPTVYIYKISDRRYGFLGREDRWDEDEEKMVHTEKQTYESVYQISSLVRQNPQTPNQYTASDLVNEVASIMQSDAAIRRLLQDEIGILRITDIRNPYFTDDRDQFEASPSFDFTLTYVQTRINESPVVGSFEFDINRV